MKRNLTNINCEMKSMAVYNPLFATDIQRVSSRNLKRLSTANWGRISKSQLNAVHIWGDNLR